MGFIDDLSELFNESLVATPGILDEYGAFIASGAVLNLPCRIEGESRLVRDPSGQEVVSSVQVVVAGYNDLTVERHRYTLPTRFSPNFLLRAIAIDKVSDEDEPVYEEILLP
jgi:hypothetical protein